MAKPESVFIYVGTYLDEAAAHDDYQIIKDLHSAGAVGTYDAAVVTKDYNGKVHVNKDEMATRHGAWGGAAVGAVLGILFPPSIIGTAAVGAVVGGVGGHLWRGRGPAPGEGGRGGSGESAAPPAVGGGGQKDRKEGEGAPAKGKQ